MSEPKRRIQVQLHGNQNYLNFIKKNHLSMYLIIYSAKINSMDTLAPSPLIFNPSIKAMEVVIFHSNATATTDKI